MGAQFKRIEAQDLATIPAVDSAGGIDLSPDGSEVVFAWDRTGGLEIYSAPLSGDRIIQLTTADRRSWGPRWSPDGRWVAFIRDEGDGWPQIALVDRDGEHDRALSAEPAAHADLDWSPDGRAIAYVASTTGSDATLHVVEVATGEDRQIAPRPARGPRWSPDGKWILFTSPGRSTMQLMLAPAAGGEPRALAIDGSANGGRWSPDGSAIAFTHESDGHSTVAIAHLRDGNVARIERFSATPFDDTDPAWRPDARGIVYRHHQNGDVSLRRAFTISHADEAVADLPGTHTSPAVGRDSESVVAVLSQARLPGDIVYRPAGAIEIQRITRSLPASIDPFGLVEPIIVEVPEGGSAFLYLPHVEAAGTRPSTGTLIVRDELRREWDPLAQLFANRGLVVLAAATADDAKRGGAWLEAEGLARHASLFEGGVPATPRNDRIGAFRGAADWAETAR
ncbi:MAG: PD40 domain-containing protein [Chloroflexi bacterium]|nr:PD40 domain-containing protein [Chloroflexota bacterium]